ncbi:unnamed protein product [Malus baccata var. baccata]
MSRTCSQCGNNGHNSRTCTGASGGVGGGATASAENGIMLFGIRVTEANAFRKSASMNNLSQYEQHLQADSNADAGYASDDVVHASGHRCKRKRGVAGISRNFVKTRTPTQVASHAQKYFLRRNNHNCRRRRSKDLGESSPTVVPVLPFSPQPESNLGCNILGGFPVSTEIAQTTTKLIRPIPLHPPVVPPSSKMAGLNLNKTYSSSPTRDPLPLSLKLSTTPSAGPRSLSFAISSPLPAEAGGLQRGADGDIRRTCGDAGIHEVLLLQLSCLCPSRLARAATKSLDYEEPLSTRGS